jgi:ribosomal-protein-alanine N-acetyltransferase
VVEQRLGPSALLPELDRFAQIGKIRRGIELGFEVRRDPLEVGLGEALDALEEGGAGHDDKIAPTPEECNAVLTGKRSATPRRCYAAATMELLTVRLLLREFEERDAPDCNAYEREPEVARYQSSDVRTLDESLAYIRKSLATTRETPRRTFDLAIVLRADGRLVGRAGVHVTDPTAREGTLWYVLHPAHWGKGYVPEAGRALLDFGFGELGLHRVFIDCDPRNLASVRVGEKLGMRREAHFVENAWIKGEWVGTLILAILDREWAARSE